MLGPGYDLTPGGLWVWHVPGIMPILLHRAFIIRDDDVAAKRAAKRWARDMEGKAGSGTWMWWTDGSRTDDGRVGSAALCVTTEGWTVFHSSLGTGQMAVFDPELWAIGIAF
jgi:hypothetical protein